MYVVFFESGGVVFWLSTWLDYYEAYREAESLNKRDYKAYYYVKYRENFNGKNTNL